MSYGLTIEDTDEEMRKEGLVYARITKDKDILGHPKDLITGWMPKKDAFVLAAAPDLLSACKQLIDAFLEGSDSEHGHAIINAQTVIAKAEGAQ